MLRRWQPPHLKIVLKSDHFRQAYMPISTGRKQKKNTNCLQKIKSFAAFSWRQAPPSNAEAIGEPHAGRWAPLQDIFAREKSISGCCESSRVKKWNRGKRVVSCISAKLLARHSEKLRGLQPNRKPNIPASIGSADLDSLSADSSYSF